MRGPWTKDRRSDHDEDGNWRQVLDPFDAHVVDHHGLLWVWQPGGGYLPTVVGPAGSRDPVFYVDVMYDD